MLISARVSHRLGGGARSDTQLGLDFRDGDGEAPRGWGGRRPNSGRKRRNPKARPNVPHRVRPLHGRRNPVHVTMRAGRGVPRFRSELVSNLLKEVLKRQRKRPYSRDFQVVHFSIQNDHLHLIVEATTDASDEEAEKALRKGVSGFAISFARRLNRLVGRKGKVWADRHHRRDIPSPTEVRNLLVYVFQNYRHHGHVTIGTGIVDPYSSACRFDGWLDRHVTFVEREPWPDARPRTWLLRSGWLRGGGPLATSEIPRAWEAPGRGVPPPDGSMRGGSVESVRSDGGSAIGSDQHGVDRILVELVRASFNPDARLRGDVASHTRH
jgi:putative transposase